MFASYKKGAEKYHLLRGDETLNEDDSHNPGPNRSSEALEQFLSLEKERRASRRFDYILTVSALLNLLLVSLCLFYVFRQSHGAPSSLVNNEMTPYAKLSRDPSARWPYDTGYGPEVTNHSLLDERWESISFNEGIVAIDHAWAHDQNLGPSQDFPWDQSKGLYVITAYHTIHCLMTVHRLVYELHHGLPRTRSTEHALHCLAHMRTDAMCEADDFLLPTDRTQYMRPGPRGQPRVCRNWDRLVSWADQHNACYQHISDDEVMFAEERDEIERYFGCPEDSPYYQTMMEYKIRKGY